MQISSIRTITPYEVNQTVDKLAAGKVPLEKAEALLQGAAEVDDNKQLRKAWKRLEAEIALQRKILVPRNPGNGHAEDPRKAEAQEPSLKELIANYLRQVRAEARNSNLDTAQDRLDKATTLLKQADDSTRKKFKHSLERAQKTLLYKVDGYYIAKTDA